MVSKELVYYIHVDKEINPSTNGVTIMTNTNTNTNTQITTQEFNPNTLLDDLKSKSAVIRFLHTNGMDCKSIYKLLTQYEWKNNSGTNPIRYQHVRNVLVTPIKKNG